MDVKRDPLECCDEPGEGSLPVQPVITQAIELTGTSDRQSIRPCTRRKQGKDPHPPGFRTLVQRVDKFSDCQADDDFEVWLMDFEEATRLWMAR